MNVFLDFEASSLAKHGYPIEVGWVFEDGRERSCLIRPPVEWSDWDPAAEAIHGIRRETLISDGEEVAAVAARMVDELGGHALHASAPSWDGKWLSALLRAGGLPRHALRLRDTEDAQRDSARAVLDGRVPQAEVESLAGEAVALAEVRSREQPPAHRALADARAERARWMLVREIAGELAARRSANTDVRS